MHGIGIVAKVHSGRQQNYLDHLIISSMHFPSAAISILGLQVVVSGLLLLLGPSQISAFSHEWHVCTTNAHAHAHAQTTTFLSKPHFLTSLNLNANSNKEDSNLRLNFHEEDDNNDNKDNNDNISNLVRSVNYFISRECNYNCKFCFHTQTNKSKFQFHQARYGLQLLKKAGTQKINFAGGEPFLNPILLGDLCQVASEELGMAVSIISNGSMITDKWMDTYAKYVDVLGVSVDSFDAKTNAAIGRGGDANNQHATRVLKVREMCAKHGVLFKMNTVVCSLNWEEDMNEHVEKLDPYRWKAFQVLILEGENSGRVGDLCDATSLKVSQGQFEEFCERHSGQRALIPENNDTMQNSYLLLDEELRFLDCSTGGKIPSESILKVGVGRALQQAGFDYEMFEKRGGIYEWERNKDEVKVL